MRDNEGEYGFVPPPRPLSTEAAGSDVLRNVVEIAGRRFVQALPAGGRGGFQVVVADPDTLQGKSYWFETSGLPSSDATFKTLLDLAALLKNVNSEGAQPFSEPRPGRDREPGHPAPAERRQLARLVAGRGPDRAARRHSQRVPQRGGSGTSS